MFKIRVPATSANLGPGFDCLGIALDLFNYISVEETEMGLDIEIEGEGSNELARNETNLTYQAMGKVFKMLNYKPKGIKIKQTNNIPLSRGLGSSAAAIVGGLVAANKICGEPLTQDRILELATEMEGHPDNVAPALLGGVIVVEKSNSKINWIKINPPRDLSVIIAVPDFTLSTKLARSVLPATVPFKDAVFNVSKVALLVSSLCTGQIDKLKYALSDTLHQPYRGSLIPGMENVFKETEAAGALGSVISGAGPTIIAFAKNNKQEIERAMKESFKKVGVNCNTIMLSMLDTGVKIYS